jgi:hypothetical protein
MEEFFRKGGVLTGACGEMQQQILVPIAHFNCTINLASF